MIKYRIKEKNNHFYPQYKNGLETLWCWNAILRSSMEQYENGRGSDGYVESFFFTLTEAEDFIQTYKKKKEIKIHKI